MKTALVIAGVILLISVWVSFAAWRLRSRNALYGRGIRRFQPRWSSGRRHRRRPEFRRRF
jgi:hypothetical protein